MTQHHDLTIRFQDLDARLLAGTEESHLQTSFPKPLHDLTIDVASLLSEPSLASQIPSTLLLNARITCVDLARETLDCAIALQSGEVVVYRLPSPLDQEKNVISDSQPGSDLISLVDFVVANPGRFQPVALLNAGRGPVTCLSVSDIGKDLSSGYQNNV
jgi:syntaxin-binding protein 5